MITVNELIELYENNNKNGGLFFTDESMDFFGDSISNYGVEVDTLKHKWRDEPPIQGYVLYRIRPVKNGLQSPAFFSLTGRHLPAHEVNQ